MCACQAGVALDIDVSRNDLLRNGGGSVDESATPRYYPATQQGAIAEEPYCHPDLAPPPAYSESEVKVSVQE